MVIQNTKERSFVLSHYFNIEWSSYREMFLAWHTYLILNIHIPKFKSVLNRRKYPFILKVIYSTDFCKPRSNKYFVVDITLRFMHNSNLPFFYHIVACAKLIFAKNCNLNASNIFRLYYH